MACIACSADMTNSLALSMSCKQYRWMSCLLFGSVLMARYAICRTNHGWYFPSVSPYVFDVRVDVGSVSFAGVSRVRRTTKNSNARWSRRNVREPLSRPLSFFRAVRFSRISKSIMVWRVVNSSGWSARWSWIMLFLCFMSLATNPNTVPRSDNNLWKENGKKRISIFLSFLISFFFVSVLN